MMKILKLKNIIKDIKKFIDWKKKLNDTAIKDIRNLYRLEKKTKKLKQLKIEYLDIIRTFLQLQKIKKKIIINH